MKMLDLKNGIMAATELNKFKEKGNKIDKKGMFGYDDLIDEYL